MILALQHGADSTSVGSAPNFLGLRITRDIAPADQNQNADAPSGRWWHTPPRLRSFASSKAAFRRSLDASFQLSWLVQLLVMAGQLRRIRARLTKKVIDVRAAMWGTTSEAREWASPFDTSVSADY